MGLADLGNYSVSAVVRSIPDPINQSASADQRLLGSGIARGDIAAQIAAVVDRVAESRAKAVAAADSREDDDEEEEDYLQSEINFGRSTGADPAPAEGGGDLVAVIDDAREASESSGLLAALLMPKAAAIFSNTTMSGVGCDVKNITSAAVSAALACVLPASSTGIIGGPKQGATVMSVSQQDPWWT